MADILLDTLKNGLDNSSLHYLESDDQLRSNCEEYLQELLINDEFLSTDTYTTNNAHETASESGKKNLIEEIAELDQKKRQVSRDLSSITKDNRDLIIDISNDLDDVSESFSKEYVREIEAVVKLLENSNRSQVNKFEIISNERLKNDIKINNSLLSNIESVLDLLELPALCKLCILQGNYQEALEISVLVQSLVIRFPKLAFFKSIRQQIDVELKLMVKGLIKLLNTDLKQNHILKIFQILNQLDIIEDESSFSFSKLYDKKSHKEKFLKIIYLNARFKFLSNEASNLKPLIKYNKLTYLKRFIEIYREYIFSSLSMYYAIFNPSVAFNNENKSEGDLLVSQFITNLACLLTDELALYLPQISKSEKDTDSEEIDIQSQRDGLVLQIIYLCRSLSKYNVDFESIITWNLCYGESPVISEENWLQNMAKVKKFKS